MNCADFEILLCDQIDGTTQMCRGDIRNFVEHSDHRRTIARLLQQLGRAAEIGDVVTAKGKGA